MKNWTVGVSGSKASTRHFVSLLTGSQQEWKGVWKWYHGWSTALHRQGWSSSHVLYVWSSTHMCVCQGLSFHVHVARTRALTRLVFSYLANEMITFSCVSVVISLSQQNIDKRSDHKLQTTIYYRSLPSWMSVCAPVCLSAVHSSVCMPSW